MSPDYLIAMAIPDFVLKLFQTSIRLVYREYLLSKYLEFKMTNNILLNSSKKSSFSFLFIGKNFKSIVFFKLLRM